MAYRRIACLSTEAVETLYPLGAADLIAGILRMIATLAALVDKAEAGERLVAELQGRLDAARGCARAHADRPRIYFEEWSDPLISGIRWVSEMVDAAGGVDCFAKESHRGAARERVISDPAEVVRRAPDIIIGSWCGRKFQPDHVRMRPGWAAVPAVRDDHLGEIKCADILSPGPAAITEGLAQLERIVERWRASRMPLRHEPRLRHGCSCKQS